MAIYFSAVYSRKFFKTVYNNINRLYEKMETLYYRYYKTQAMVSCIKITNLKWIVHRVGFCGVLEAAVKSA